MTCAEQFSNDTVTFLATDVFPADATISVVSIDGFPTTETFRIMIDDEIMVVTAGAGTTTWAVDRAQEGRDAQFHASGEEIANVFTVGSMNSYYECRFSTGTRASRPAAELEGRSYFTTSPGWYLYREDGVGWSAWGPTFQTFEISQFDFEWTNQSDATNPFAAVNEEFGGSIMEVPAPLSAGENVRMLTQDIAFEAPMTAPFMVTVGFRPMLDPNNQTSCGIIFRESSTEKFIFFRLMYDDSSSITKHDVVLSLDKYTDATTLDSNYKILSASMFLGPIVWLQMEDDSVDLHWRFSVDGKNFALFDTRTRTDFLASGPDEIGFGVNSNNTAGSAIMDLLSWKKE